jgi:hypothetical protein
LLDDVGLKPAFDDLIISTPKALLLVETGEYEAVCISCRKEKRFKRDLLALKFKLTTQCQYFGMVLDAYLNLDSGKGSTRKAPLRSKLAAWMRAIAKFDPSIDVVKFKVSTKDSSQSACEPCSRVTQIVAVVGRLGGGAR